MCAFFRVFWKGRTSRICQEGVKEEGVKARSTCCSQSKWTAGVARGWAGAQCGTHNTMHTLDICVRCRVWSSADKPLAQETHTLGNHGGPPLSSNLLPLWSQCVSCDLSLN